MPLHFPTLGLVLLTVGIHTSVIMIIIWRMYRQMKGPGYWAIAALLTMLGFLPMWLEPKIGTIAIILNNFATVTTPLLIFEGIIKFRNLHPFDRVRIPGEFLFAGIYLLSTILNLENIRGRYLVNDFMMMIVLALTIVVLLWKQEGLERLVYTVIAATFALMLIAFCIRWVFSLNSGKTVNDPNQILTTLIFFTLVPWAIGWSYGFVLVINIKGRQALYEAARRDPLTGLLNRLWMAEHFDPSLQNAAMASKKYLCLTILDINGFKRINDEFGHLYGDAVLQQAGQAILQQLEEGDFAIRYGGDEFILLLTCYNSEDILAQKLHRIINAIESPAIIENTSMILSMSYGSAKFPTDGTTSDELFKVADQRMYMQKRSRTK